MTTTLYPATKYCRISGIVKTALRVSFWRNTEMLITRKRVTVDTMVTKLLFFMPFRGDIIVEYVYSTQRPVFKLHRVASTREPTLRAFCADTGVHLMHAVFDVLLLHFEL